MTTLILRHGESEGNDINRLCPPDRESAITQRGLEETRFAAEAIGFVLKRPFVIYSGPALRAVQSSEIVSAALRKPHRILEELRETHEVLSPTAHDTLHRQTVAFWQSYYRSTEQQKRVVEAHREALRVFDMIRLEELEGHDVILVTHGGKAEMLLNVMIGDLSPRLSTVQFSLGLSRCHLIDLVIAGSEVSHINIRRLNAGFDDLRGERSENEISATVT